MASKRGRTRRVTSEMTNFEKVMCSGKNLWRKLEKEKVGKNRTKKEVNEHDANKIITQNDKD